MDADFEALLRQVEGDWDRFLTALSEASPARAVIAESWQRCRAAGVDPGGATLHHVSAAELNRRLERNADLVELARLHLEWVSAALAEVPHVLYLVDRDGIVLFSTGTDRDTMEGAGLRPGYDWSERRMGTNGAGTALAGGHPVAVVGPEHFVAAYHVCTCTAAPIRDPAGAILGAIDLTTANLSGVPLRLTLVSHAARVVERELAGRVAARRSDSLLAAIDATLTAPLDAKRVLDCIARAVVPGLADYCVIYTADVPRRSQRIAVAHRDAHKEERLRELDRLYRPDPEDPVSWVGRVLRTGEPLRLEEVAWSAVTAMPLPAEVVRIIEEVSPASALIVPLEARGQVRGAMILVYSESRRRYSEGELALAEAIGFRAALALEHAELYEQAGREITERVRVEAELREAKETAEEANRAKDQLLAVVSHELRTPLTAVLGYADLLTREVSGPVNTRQREQLGRISRSARHLLGLIEEILAFARTEAGADQARHDRVDLAKIVRNSAALLEPQARDKGVTLAVHGAAERVVVESDGGKVRQILTNLIGNAVKFTDRGEIQVELDRSAGDWVDVHVRDTGPGIPADQQERIFEPFARAHGSTAEEKGGTGLGLAVCRRFARMLGGEVTVESRPGAGSSFTLRLPARAPEPAPHP